MQAIFETGFDILYLCTVTLLGVAMVRGARGRKQYLMLGLMAIILGCGDAFHLVPRAWALCTTGLESHAAALGVGKLVTSVTMTVFYLLLYHVWRERYQIKGRTGLTAALYLLAAVRVGLCLFPQNEWLVYNPPILWGVLRNIPFAIMGLIMIVIFYQEAKRANDKFFRRMWLAITLSFGFYIPVVLWAEVVPLVGMLMIPKTVAYVWAVWMGYSAFRDTGSAR
ncbi:MAG: hypothetical protein EOM52_02895 [Clostridia bacterium]|nr:hypothetical protein [Clostridia bacterium]